MAAEKAAYFMLDLDGKAKKGEFQDWLNIDSHLVAASRPDVRGRTVLQYIDAHADQPGEREWGIEETLVKQL